MCAKNNYTLCACHSFEITVFLKFISVIIILLHRVTDGLQKLFI